MAPSNPKKKDPPPASSSEEEDSSSEKSTSDEEQNPMPPPKSASKPPNPKTTPNADEESGSDTSTDDDSDSDEEESVPKQQPVKPVVAAENVKETLTLTEAQPKLNVSSSQIKTKKRKIERTTTTTTDVLQEDNKKAKDEGPKTEETSKKVLFQRRFSEEDEIALLEGLHEFMKIGKEYIVTDVDEFFEYVKNFIKCDFNKKQMADKIRRLKKKYFNKSSRKRKNGDDPIFSKPHDFKSYNLSKTIWGEKKASISTPILRPTPKHTAPKRSQTSDGKDVRKLDLDFESFKDLNESAAVVKYGLEMVDETKRAQLEESWKKLSMAHLELFVKKTELTLELAEIALQHVKSANH